MENVGVSESLSRSFFFIAKFPPPGPRIFLILEFGEATLLRAKKWAYTYAHLFVSPLTKLETKNLSIYRRYSGRYSGISEAN